MDTFSIAEAATTLGVCTPRVYRAFPGRRSLSAADVKGLKSSWGFVPEGLGLPRTHAFVLAALVRSPLGLDSARAVARRSAVSPTCASRALDYLDATGLVTSNGVFKINRRSARLASIADVLGEVVLPADKTRISRRGQTRVPARLGKWFWNQRLDRLRVDQHCDLIADRLLRESNTQGLAWAAAAVPSSAWYRVAQGRGLHPGDAMLARLLAAK